MSKHQNVLNDVREVLIYCASPPGTLPPQNQAQFRIAQDVLARLDAFLTDVPEALHDEKLRHGDYWYHECVTLLHTATTKGGA